MRLCRRLPAVLIVKDTLKSGKTAVYSSTQSFLDAMDSDGIKSFIRFPRQKAARKGSGRREYFVYFQRRRRSMAPF